MDTNIRKTKTQQAVEAFTAGQFKKALQLTATFRLDLSKSDQALLRRGYECLVWPDQYRQMGKDPEACVAAALGLFQQKFINGGEA